MAKLHFREHKLWKAAQSHKKYLLLLLAVFSVLLIFSVLLWRCSSGGKYEFHSRKAALTEYQGYLNKVRSITRSNTEDFSKLLCEWREIRDSVYTYLANDSAFTKYHNDGNEFYAIHDSIRTEMRRLTESWHFDYKDYLSIKEATCPFRQDTILQNAVRSAEQFFRELDAEPISKCDKSSILSRYRYFLSETKKEGIHNKDEMLKFIRIEDFYFRTFLAHLHEMRNEQLSDITRDTEQICISIFASTKENQIPVADAVVYMHMRTTRRLLQNSVECVREINQIDAEDKAQANAYLWMIIQPFLSINQFAFATMTEQDRKQFDYIAAQLPKSKRFAETFDINLKALNYLLPQQLLKFYVSTL